MNMQPEVDLRIDGTSKTYQLTVTYDDCVIPLDAEQASQLVADLSAGMSLLMAQDAPNVPEMPAQRKGLHSGRHARIDGSVDLKWHRERVGSSTYYAHPTPDVTVRAQKVGKGWVGVINGDIVTEELVSKEAAKNAVTRVLTNH